MTEAGRGAGGAPRAAALEETDRALLSEYAGCVATLLAALDESGPAAGAAGPGGAPAISEARRLASLREASLGARARFLARTREALARSAERASRPSAGTADGGRA